MDMFQTALLCLVVGAVIADQLYRFRVLLAPDTYDREREPRQEHPRPKKKKGKRNARPDYLDEGEDLSRHRRNPSGSNGQHNGNGKRSGGGGGFSPP